MLTGIEPPSLDLMAEEREARRSEWAKAHTCVDCRRFQPCPCGCGWGMCAEDPYREFFAPEDTVYSLGCEEAVPW